MTRISNWLLAVAALVALAPIATAQDYEAQVAAQLDGAGYELHDAGFTQLYDHRIESLGEGAEETFGISLEANRQYAFVGACDVDCEDMDFWLYDEDGNLIDSDTTTDDVPVVVVTPSWSGPFTVRVMMYECSAEPCYYGIGVFGD